MIKSKLIMSQKKKKIVIIDDCDKEKLTNEQLKHLFFNGRHTSLPIFVQKQKYKMYPNPHNDPTINEMNKRLQKLNAEIDENN